MAPSFRPALLFLAALLTLAATVAAAPSPLITPAAVADDVEKREADVATARGWKREEEERDLLGDLLNGLAGGDDDSPTPVTPVAAVASPKGWKRDELLDGPAPTPVEKRADFVEDVTTPRGWKRDGIVATPRPFVS